MDDNTIASSSSKSSLRGWHSRGYLPHFDGGEIAQAITFHLADSIPQKVLEELSLEAEVLKASGRDAQRRKRIDELLDKGYGNLWLQDHRIAKLVEDAFLYFDGERYRLLAWVIMPNHAHLLIIAVNSWSLSAIVHSWKSYTAKQADKILKTSGKFWQEDYFDRFIRDEKHFRAALAYIEANPVKARLCENKEEWRFSSASYNRRLLEINDRRIE